MNRIKQLREEKDWSQNELAKKMNCAPSSIAMYEKGDRKPSMEVLIKLSEIFNCSIDYLTDRSFYRNYEEFVKIDEYVSEYMLNNASSHISKLIATTLNYINFHKNEDVDKIIRDAVKNMSSGDQSKLILVISHLHYRYHGKLPQKSDMKTLDKDDQEFRFAYHKEMEGLTDEEISDALRFYKEMKKKVKGDN